MAWPRLFHRKATNAAEDEAVTRGIIATAAVKAEAMTLVGDIRQTLRDLDRVLQDEGGMDETGRVNDHARGVADDG